MRISIAEELQGRAWGLIGFISQMGFVVAYALAGLLADGIAVKSGLSVGRGAAIVVIISGVLLVLTAPGVFLTKSIRGLEEKNS